MPIDLCRFRVSVLCGALVWTMASSAPSRVAGAETDRYFPANLLHAQWQEFRAAGFSVPVTGVVYRGNPRPTCGMPLGGLDVGCLDLEANGMWGYDTRFNHLASPRLLHNEPVAGISVGGKTTVLVSDDRGKRDRPIPNETGVFPPLDYSPSFFPVGLRGVDKARAIDYFGHYPMVDLEFDVDGPVSVGLRAWAPFLPGDAKSSMTPGFVLEFALRNRSDESQHGVLAINLPDAPLPAGTSVQRSEVGDDAAKLKGVSVATSASGTPAAFSYVAAVQGADSVRTGGRLGTDGSAWGRIDRELPPAGGKSFGASLAVDFELEPRQATVRRIVVAWHAPLWNAGGAPDVAQANAFRHMYAKHYADAQAAARYLAQDGDSLLRRIIAWQEAIYAHKTIPGWLADCLINNLHLVAETSIWGQSEGKLAQFPPESGLFALNECPRGCPQLECIPCSFYGNMPIVYFFPEAALSTLRGYKAYQYADGRPPWIFGGMTAIEPANKNPYDLAAPDKGYQTILNAACYVVMVDRYWRATGDDAVLAEFYESLKKANDFSLNLRPKFGDSQVMAMPEPGTDAGGLGDTEWFEAPEPGWKGYVTHAGGVRMAQVQIMKRMAESMGDAAYAARCAQWLDAGAHALEEKLWNGEYYLNFNDPDGGVKSDMIFGYQLDGEWVCDSHGVPGVFPKPRVDAALRTIRRANCALSQSGATNYANPDGGAAKVGGYGAFGYFPPELMMLAMTYMYEGERDFGVDLLRRCMENIVCQWGYAWDAPNTIRGDMDTGQRHFGADYYQNMMLWLVPAALEGGDLTAPLEQQGLVRRVLDAAAP